MLQAILVLNTEPRQQHCLVNVVILSTLLYFSVSIASFPELFKLLKLSALEKAYF
jgi:hypothetical protein